MKNLPVIPESKNPTSVRLTEEDRKALEKAEEIIKRRYILPPGFRLNPSNILRIALHDFVDGKSNESA